ncbi:MAG: thiol peroxidase [Deltaproteobacteria bacterium]|nr:thiol peroxidase [Deltaproteobacteria bacterium]MCB9490003.1 thiol peroxidase [Deltaproteobacteria bacterium]
MPWNNAKRWIAPLAVLAMALVGCSSPKPEADEPVMTDQAVAEYLANLDPAARANMVSRYVGQNAQPVLPERRNVVHRGEAPMTLVGHALKVGETAPTFELLGVGKDQTVQTITSAALFGQPTVVSVVPSLDTTVCATQTGHMAALAEELPAGVQVVTISRDLPFAQQRFVQDNDLAMTTVSDFKDGSLGKDWGLYLKENGLLARSLWFVDAGGRILYSQIVPDITQEPNYDELKAAVTAWKQRADAAKTGTAPQAPTLGPGGAETYGSG